MVVHSPSVTQLVSGGLESSAHSEFVGFSSLEIATPLKDIGVNFMCGSLTPPLGWHQGQKEEADDHPLTLTTASPQICSRLWTVCGWFGGWAEAAQILPNSPVKPIRTTSQARMLW